MGGQEPVSGSRPRVSGSSLGQRRSSTDQVGGSEHGVNWRKQIHVRNKIGKNR